MGLTVYTYARRVKPPGRGGPRLQNQQSWDVIHFVRALKKEPLNNTARIPMQTGERLRYIGQSNQAEAFAIFAEMVAPTRAQKSSTAVIVPVPGSKDTSEQAVREGGTYLMARALAERIGASVEPCLWWRQAMPSAHHENGSRDPAVLVPNLVHGEVPAGKVVLLDDVITTGGHLSAAACVLRRAGARVAFAVCAARSQSYEEGDMFRKANIELEWFEE